MPSNPAPTPTTPAAPATTAPGPTVPPPATAGVTLRDVDGGAGYFGRWANSFPTDPSFFPIGIWAETLADPAFIGQYKALGVNTFTNLWNGPTTDVMDQLKTNGMYGIADTPDSSLTASFNATYGNKLAGRYYQDEGDGRDVCGDQPTWLKVLCFTTPQGRTSPVALKNMADAIRAKDPTRPIFGQFTKPVALLDYLSESEARAYVDGVDIVSFDWYPLTDGYTPGQLWEQADAVQTTRRLSGYAKPVWPAIETSYVFPDTTYRPTPAEVSAEVWNAVIGGARGIQYFNHSFSPIAGTQRVLLDPRYADIAAAVKTTNLRIAELAPVLNAPYADGLVTVTGGSVNHMVKAFNGSYYVFVAGRSRAAQNVNLQFNGLADATATVLYENRTVPVAGGQLNDTLPNETTIHIYKITPGA